MSSNIGVGGGTFEAESTHNVNNQIHVTNEAEINVKKEAHLQGFVLDADIIRANVGKMLLESLQDSASSSGLQGHLGLNPLELKEASQALNSIGVGHQASSSRWVHQLSGLLGRRRVEVIVREALKLSGSVIANAYQEDGKLVDGGNLMVQAADLIVEDIANFDQGHTLGLAAQNVLKEQADILGPTYSGTFGMKDKTGKTKATGGKGQWIINGALKSREELGLNTNLEDMNEDLTGLDISPIHWTYTSIDWDKVKQADLLNPEMFSARAKAGFEKGIHEIQELATQVASWKDSLFISHERDVIEAALNRDIAQAAKTQEISEAEKAVVAAEVKALAQELAEARSLMGELERAQQNKPQKASRPVTKESPSTEGDRYDPSLPDFSEETVVQRDPLYERSYSGLLYYSAVRLKAVQERYQALRYNHPWAAVAIDWTSEALATMGAQAVDLFETVGTLGLNKVYGALPEDVRAKVEKPINDLFASGEKALTPHLSKGLQLVEEALGGNRQDSIIVGEALLAFATIAPQGRLLKSAAASGVKGAWATATGLDLGLVRAYVTDVEARTGIALHPLQKEQLKQALRAQKFEKLPSEVYSKHNRKFTPEARNQLIKEWEDKTGLVWPKYSSDLKNADGTLSKEAGRHYQAHHIIHQSHGGPHEWWNMYPVHKSQHQGGLHGKSAPGELLHNK